MDSLERVIQRWFIITDGKTAEFYEGFNRAKRGEQTAESWLEQINPFRAIECRQERREGFQAGCLEMHLYQQMQELSEKVKR